MGPGDWIAAFRIKVLMGGISPEDMRAFMVLAVVRMLDREARFRGSSSWECDEGAVERIPLRDEAVEGSRTAYIVWYWLE